MKQQHTQPRNNIQKRLFCFVRKEKNNQFHSDLARRLFTMTAPIAVPMTMIPATVTIDMANAVKK